MTNTYIAPPPPGADGDSFEVKEHKGALLRIEVLGTKLIEGTRFGDKDAIVANVVVLDGEHKGDTYDDTLLFPSVLYGQLKGSVGSVVLGRLGQGENKKGNPPWLLNAPTEDDIAVARKYDAHIAEKTAKSEEPW